MLQCVDTLWFQQGTVGELPRINRLGNLGHAAWVKTPSLVHPGRLLTISDRSTRVACLTHPKSKEQADLNAETVCEKDCRQVDVFRGLDN